MTNKEYIEKNNISFSEAMKMYDNIKYPCINDWLNQEHQEHKFKVGDFVIINGDISKIGVVIDVKDYVYVKWLKWDGSFARWNQAGDINKYHRNENDVFYIMDESSYEKVF